MWRLLSSLAAEPAASKVAQLRLWLAERISTREAFAVQPLELNEALYRHAELLASGNFPSLGNGSDPSQISRGLVPRSDLGSEPFPRLGRYYSVLLITSFQRRAETRDVFASRFTVPPLDRLLLSDQDHGLEPWLEEVIRQDWNGSVLVHGSTRLL